MSRTMDLRHMRQFLAVAEELHFGRAAQRLGMAQPPLSQSIQRIEAELGVKLLDRTRRGVWLTAPGRVLMEEARRTLMQAELAVTVTKRAAASDIARIHIGLIGPALYRLVPNILVAHRGAYPEVEVRLSERSSPVQMEGIMRGDLDVGFLHPSSEVIEGGDQIIVERSRFLAAIPADWPIAACSAVSLKDIAELPFIIMDEAVSPSSFQQVISAFRNVGVMPDITQRTTLTNTTLSLVSASLGCALVAASAAHTQLRNVRFLPVTDIPNAMRWEMSMVWSPNHISIATRNFVELVKRFVLEHDDLLNIDATLVEPFRVTA